MLDTAGPGGTGLSGIKLAVSIRFSRAALRSSMSVPLLDLCASIAMLILVSILLANLGEQFYTDRLRQRAHPYQIN